MYGETGKPMVYEDPARERRLWANIRRLTQAVVMSSSAPAGFVRRELPTVEGQMDVYTTVTGDRTGDEKTVVVVVTPPVATSSPTCADVRREFGLTKREAEVALLLAARRSNKEIADHLSIADKTAWRHTERVMAKLNTSSRRDVGRVLRSGRSRTRARSRPPAPPVAAAVTH